ncbi:hypothetical protein D3C80_1892670 [compost metagenome]
MIGERSFEWEFGDTLAVPSWTRVEHLAETESVLFAMSDEYLMRWVHYYRHEAMA